jgi:hypothetical protein
MLAGLVLPLLATSQAAAAQGPFVWRVRAWAVVSGERVLAGSPHPHVIRTQSSPHCYAKDAAGDNRPVAFCGGGPGTVIVKWRARFSKRCAVLATGWPLYIGSTNPESASAMPYARGEVLVTTYDTQGQPAPFPFSVAVIC